jgi:hypothetical protein
VMHGGSVRGDVFMGSSERSQETVQDFENGKSKGTRTRQASSVS